MVCILPILRFVLAMLVLLESCSLEECSETSNKLKRNRTGLIWTPGEEGTLYSDETSYEKEGLPHPRLDADEGARAQEQKKVAEEAKEKQEILRRAQELQRREEEAQVCLSPAEGMLRVMQLWS